MNKLTMGKNLNEIKYFGELWGKIEYWGNVWEKRIRTNSFSNAQKKFNKRLFGVGKKIFPISPTIQFFPRQLFECLIFTI